MPTSSAIHKGYVTLAEGQVHYRERAGHGPAIVFLHQTALSSRSYERLLAALSLPHRLIAPDTPGFGQSFAPDGWPSMPQYARWLLAALDALGVGEAHLFGHHTGASLAVEMARLQPARIRSLMLCGPVCFTKEESDGFRDDFRRALAPAADGSHLLENWRYTADNNAGVAPEVVHDQVVDMLIAWRGRPQAYIAVADQDFPPAFEATRAPTLILSSAGDYFEDHVERCRALRPDAEVVEIGGGNLAPELDAPGTARAVERFIRAIEISPAGAPPGK